MILRSRTIAGFVALAVLALGGDFGLPPGAWALSRGQVVVAFGPELTGDPQNDFSRALGSGETVTLYVIAGSLPLPARRFSFGLGISESQNLVMQEVRTFGFAHVEASQSDLGTIVRVAVDAAPTCFDVGSDAVLAEVDLVRTGEEVPVGIHLGSFLYETSSPPEMESCQGVAFFFDDSMAQNLSVLASGPTSVTQTGWAMMKSLYRSP